MIRTVGLDVHKHFIEVCILDARGKVLSRGQVNCQREELQHFAKTQLKKTDRVALEATTNTWPVVEILRPCVAAVVVSNPLKTKAIAEAKIKTDKVDALVLAQLLRCDYLPDVWQPDTATQTQRSLITHRSGLMCQRARHKNRIQCLLGRLLLTPPCKLLWTKVGLTWLQALSLSPTDRLMLDSELRQLGQVERELVVVDQQFVEIARQEPRVQLLMTLPGVNYVVALGLLAALGDITRFADGDHAASYLGLAPVTRQSGAKCYHGHITKAGNSQARWLLTQSAQHVTRHSGPLGAFFRRLAKRKNRQVAIIAVTRKLVTVAYLMLKNNEPYRYARPDLMATKFTALQSKHRGATSRSEKPSLRGPARAGLAKVYQAAGLPSVTVPEQLSHGEQRMLTQHKLTDFVGQLYQPSPTATVKPDNPKRATSPTTKTRGRPAGRPR
jgi:transposase